MFSPHKSHELKSSTKCPNCGHDVVKLKRQVAEVFDGVRYSLQCNHCQYFRYGMQTWDITRALAIIRGDMVGADNNALEHIEDEPLVSIRGETVKQRLSKFLSQRMQASMPLASSLTNSQRSISPHPGTSSGQSGLGMVRYRPDLAHTRETEQSSQKSEAHNSKKTFLCEVCGKCFERIKHLINHQYIHTGERPFACQICDKRFTIKSNLVTHLRFHTGVRPFICRICSKCFSWKSSFLYHQKHFHNHNIK